MKDQRIIRWIESKYRGLAPELTEPGRRRWAAVEAVSLGHGGIAVVSAATGLAHSTIRRGIAELDTGDGPPVNSHPVQGHSFHPGRPGELSSPFRWPTVSGVV